jgi:hypothetical protein
MIGRQLPTGSALRSLPDVAAFARALGTREPLYVDPTRPDVAPSPSSRRRRTDHLHDGRWRADDTFLELGLNFDARTRREEEYRSRIREARR